MFTSTFCHLQRAQYRKNGEGNPQPGSITFGLTFFPLESISLTNTLFVTSYGLHPRKSYI